MGTPCLRQIRERAGIAGHATLVVRAVERNVVVADARVIPVQAPPAPAVVGLPRVDRGLDENGRTPRARRAHDKWNPGAPTHVGALREHEVCEVIAARPVRAGADGVGHRPVQRKQPGRRIGAWNRLARAGSRRRAPGYAGEDSPASSAVPADAIDDDAVAGTCGRRDVEMKRVARGDADFRGVAFDPRHTWSPHHPGSCPGVLVLERDDVQTQAGVRWICCERCSGAAERAQHRAAREPQ